MGTEASHKSVLSSIIHKPELEPPQRPPCELTAEPTDAGASRGSDRKLAAAPLTASAFASPDVSQERPLPFVPSSGAGTTHLRWSPSGPPRERGRDWGGHRGFRGCGCSYVTLSADMCAHTASFCSTEPSSSFRVLLKHRGHPVTQGHRRIAGMGPPGNRKWRLSEQWTPGLTGAASTLSGGRHLRHWAPRTKPTPHGMNR